MIVGSWYKPIDEMRMTIWRPGTTGALAFVKGKRYQCVGATIGQNNRLEFEFDSELAPGHRIIEDWGWYWNMEPETPAERLVFHIRKAGRA